MTPQETIKAWWATNPTIEFGVESGNEWIYVQITTDIKAEIGYYNVLRNVRDYVDESGRTLYGSVVESRGINYVEFWNGEDLISVQDIEEAITDKYEI